MHIYKKKSPKEVLATTLREGQVAIITAWSKDGEDYINNIVIRYDNTLITIGRHIQWSNLKGLSKDCKIKILKPRTKLVV